MVLIYFYINVNIFLESDFLKNMIIFPINRSWTATFPLNFFHSNDVYVYV